MLMARRRYRSVIRYDRQGQWRRGAVHRLSGSPFVKTAKANAVRLLDYLGVPFELRAYEVDPQDLAAALFPKLVEAFCLQRV
jgi:hypothetical protein